MPRGVYLWQIFPPLLGHRRTSNALELWIFLRRKSKWNSLFIESGIKNNIELGNIARDDFYEIVRSERSS